MITYETCIYAGNWRISFSVHDDEEWLVSISNDELEVGATSMPCQPVWNAGLANVVERISDIISADEYHDLCLALYNNKNIDNDFLIHMNSKNIPWRWTLCVSESLDDDYEQVVEFVKKYPTEETAREAIAKYNKCWGYTPLTLTHPDGTEEDVYYYGDE